MNYHRICLRSLAGAMLGFIAIALTLAWTLSPAFNAPVLPPTIELAYQAALADEHVLVTGAATLNDQLRSIDIRTALEDTQRLRYDLG